MNLRKNSSIILMTLLLVVGRMGAGYVDAGEWRKTDDAWILTEGDQLVGRWLTESNPSLTVDDSVETFGDGVYRLTRTVRNASGSAIENLRLTFDFVRDTKTNFAMIPAVCYHGNHWGRGGEPKGFQHEGTYWTFSSDRTPVPGATYSQDEQWAVAMWGELSEAFPVFACSLIPEESTTTHRLIWPEEELPLRYTGRDQFGPAVRRTWTLPADGSQTFSAILVIDQVKPGHRSVAKFLTEAWNQFTSPQGWNATHSLRKTPRTPEEIRQLAVRYAKESLWAEEGNFRGFSIGLTRQPGDATAGKTDHWIQRTSGKYEIGWCGQNASLANSLLADFLQTGNEDSRNRALATLDCWAKNAVLPNGLFCTHFDPILDGTVANMTLDSCNLGTAALNYFEAYELAKQSGVERTEYQDVALGICRFMAADQQSNGCYGKGWNTNGECLWREGTIGAFLIPPMIQAYRVTSEPRFLESARMAFAFYFGELEERGYTTAGALDTWCIDKESAYPLLRAAMMLHETTQEPQYLDAAECVSWYLSTWLWCYSGKYASQSDFVQYGWDTFGGTSVSVQHHHLDPYALLWVQDWLELAERTGNAHWREKARAVWFNGTQLISDGTLEIKGVTRPAGGQNEAYFHSPWGFYTPSTSFDAKPRSRSSDDDHTEDVSQSQSPVGLIYDPAVDSRGTLNDWLVAWPSAFRLDTLRRMTDTQRETLLP